MRDLLGLLKWLAGFTLVLVVGFPVATLFMQFGGVALGEYQARQRQQEREDKAEAFDKKYRRVVTDDRAVLQAYDNFDELVPSRLASIVLAFPKNQFSDGSLRSALSAAERAATGYAEKECEALKATIASKCRVSGTTVSPIWGHIEIRISLQFVQKSDPGSVPDTPKLRLDKVTFAYGEDDHEKIGLGEASGQMRKRSLIYSSMARDCAAVKTKHGNCSIYHIMIRSGVFGPEGKRFVRTRGSSSQSYFQPHRETNGPS